MDKLAMDTVWDVPDDLWAHVETVIQSCDPPKRLGRKRIDQRRALNGIIFRMRTGCQWNQLPEKFGDDSSVHRTFQRWGERGVLRQVWGTMAERCSDLGGLDWEWQAADGALGKARFGGGKK